MDKDVYGYGENDIRELIKKLVNNHDSLHKTIIDLYNKLASAIFTTSDSSGWYGPKAKEFEQGTLKPNVENLLKKNAELHTKLINEVCEGYRYWTQTNINHETIENYSVTLNDYARDADSNGNVVMTLGTAELIGSQQNVLDKEMFNLVGPKMRLGDQIRAFLGGNQGIALDQEITDLYHEISVMFTEFINTAKSEVAAIEEEQKATASNVARMFGSKGASSVSNTASQPKSATSTTNAKTSSTMNSKRVSASNVNSNNDEYAPGIPKHMRDHIKMRIEK